MNLPGMRIVSKSLILGSLALDLSLASLSSRPGDVTPLLPQEDVPAKAQPAKPGETAPMPAGAAGQEEIRALARRGLLDSALALCRRALQADSNDVFAAYMAAKLVPEGARSAEYFKQVQQSGKVSAETEESYFRLGQYHYAAGKYYLAIPYFRDYVRLFPRGDWKEPAYYWMGNACLSYVQAKPERLAYLDTGLVYLQLLLDKIQPDNYYYALAWEGVAKIKAAKGDGEGAWEAVRTALEKAPEDEKASITLLAAQLRHGNRAEEKEFLERLANQYPRSPEVHYLRKLNKDPDSSHWRSGTGPLRIAAPTAGADSASAHPAPAGPGEAASAAAPSQANPGSPAAKATTSANAATAPATPSHAGYTLQLGAFTQEGNAQALAASVRKQGLSPEIIESERNGKRLYQVRLGRFENAAAALDFAGKNLKPNRILFQALPVP